LIADTDAWLNDKCYMKCLKLILKLSEKHEDFRYEDVYHLCQDENIHHAFDNFDEMDVHTIDQILNVYDMQLKYLCPSKMEVDILH
jgi:hypothetical protein